MFFFQHKKKKSRKEPCGPSKAQNDSLSGLTQPLIHTGTAYAHACANDIDLVLVPMAADNAADRMAGLPKPCSEHSETDDTRAWPTFTRAAIVNGQVVNPAIAMPVDATGTVRLLDECTCVRMRVWTRAGQLCACVSRLHVRVPTCSCVDSTHEVDEVYGTHTPCYTAATHARSTGHD